MTSDTDDAPVPLEPFTGQMPETEEAGFVIPEGFGAMRLERPWIIVDELVHSAPGKFNVMLSGPPEADGRLYGIAIADAIMIIADMFSVSPKKVLRLVKHELDLQKADPSRRPSAGPGRKAAH